jgi:hypothetical protein
MGDDGNLGSSALLIRVMEVRVFAISIIIDLSSFSQAHP